MSTENDLEKNGFMKMAEEHEQLREAYVPPGIRRAVSLGA